MNKEQIIMNCIKFQFVLFFCFIVFYPPFVNAQSSDKLINLSIPQLFDLGFENVHNDKIQYVYLSTALNRVEVDFDSIYTEINEYDLYLALETLIVLSNKENIENCITIYNTYPKILNYIFEIGNKDFLDRLTYTLAQSCDILSNNGKLDFALKIARTMLVKSQKYGYINEQYAWTYVLARMQILVTDSRKQGITALENIYYDWKEEEKGEFIQRLFVDFLCTYASVLGNGIGQPSYSKINNVYDEALRNAVDDYQKIHILSEIAINDLNHEYYREAIDKLKKCIAFYEQYNVTSPSYIQSLSHLISCYIELEDYDIANKYVLKVRELIEVKELPINAKADILWNIANFYSISGQYNEARAISDSTFIMLEKSNRIRLSDEYRYLEVASSFGGNHAKGIEVAQQILKVETDPIGRSTVLARLADMYRSEGDLENGMMYIEQALDIRKKNNLEVDNILNDFGLMCLSAKKYDKAVEIYEEIVSKKPDAIYAYSNLVTALAYQNDTIGISNYIKPFLDAEKHKMKKFFSFMSEQERSNFTDFNFYAEKTALLFPNIDKCAEVAYDGALWRKSLLLNTQNYINDYLKRPENIHLKQKMQEVIELPKNDIRRVAIENEIITIASKDERFYANFNHTWQEVQSHLGPKDMAIEFCKTYDFFNRGTMNELYFALVLIPGFSSPINFFMLPPKHIPEQLTINDWFDINNCGGDGWTGVRDVIEYFQPENIFFSTDGELCTFPLEMAFHLSFPKLKTNLIRLSSTAKICDDCSFVDEENSKKKAVLYGGLKYDTTVSELVNLSKKINIDRNYQEHHILRNENLRYSVSFLPGTLKEVQEISCQLKRNKVKTTIFTEKKGIEETVQQLSGAKIDILHFATHGFYWTQEQVINRGNVHYLQKGNGFIIDTNNTLNRSGLLLSGANLGLKEVEQLPNYVADGVLTSAEIAKLDFSKVDLVTLSACQTGLGKISADGVYGLQRGFKLAGAKTLLVSLWSVDDNATQLLMTEFYNQLLSGKKKIDALRIAQEYVRENGYYDLWYWAGFVLIDALN